MEIRCGDAAKWEFLLFNIGILVSLFLFRDIRTLAIIGIYILIIPRYLYCFRRFRIYKTGVEITYLGFIQKYHSWNSFAVKQRVRHLSNQSLFKRYRRNILCSSNPLLLSLKPIYEPTIMDYRYIMRHPLSCVFIGFEDEFPDDKHRNATARHLRDFEVNREEFISKMNEWGVEIKGLTDRQE